jgi:putative transposase
LSHPNRLTFSRGQHPACPWRTAEQVELATLRYVDWFNRQRLFEACGDIPPAELEAAYYRQNTSLAEAG